MAADRPNILWISFEDTHPLYPCYGDNTAKTPNLDRLAAEGTLFPDTFSTAPVCAPARSAVITGMHPISIGTLHMRTAHTNPATPEMPTPYEAVVPHYVKCVGEYMRAAGYYCTNAFKTDYQFNSPCSAWDENDGPRAHWRHRPDPDQPFFCVFNLGQTHESGMWERDDIEITVDPDTVPVPPYFPDTPKVRLALARMYSNIEHNDKLLGEYLKELEEDGLLENTIVMHWSDHGPMPRGKRWPYDSGLRVPMIVRGPGIEPGKIDKRLVNTLDLAPTVLSLAGVAVPRHMQGRAFLGEQAGPPREYVYASRDRYDESYDMVRAVRDQRYKYIRHYHPELSYLLWIPYRNRHPIIQEMYRLHRAGELTGPARKFFEPRPPEELYDTAEDPHELVNLASDPTQAETLERLRGALDAWIDEVGDWGEVDEAAMVRQWYPNGVQPWTAPVVFIPLSEDRDGQLPEVAAGRLHCPNGVTLTGPALMQLHCATQGASICYTTEEGDDPRWLLYTGPIRLPKGTTRISTRAIRIGYKESEPRALMATVR